MVRVTKERVHLDICLLWAGTSVHKQTCIWQCALLQNQGFYGNKPALTAVHCGCRCMRPVTSAEESDGAIGFACALTGCAGRQGDENRTANRLAPARRALKAKGALFSPACKWI